jgi:hypothetical protein
MITSGTPVCRLAPEGPTGPASLSAPKSPAIGVGGSREPPFGNGPDGEDEEAVPAVPGSDAGSAQVHPLRVIPERGRIGTGCVRLYACRGSQGRRTAAWPGLME